MPFKVSENKQFIYQQGLSWALKLTLELFDFWRWCKSFFSISFEARSVWCLNGSVVLPLVSHFALI